MLENSKYQTLEEPVNYSGETQQTNQFEYLSENQTGYVYQPGDSPELSNSKQDIHSIEYVPGSSEYVPMSLEYLPMSPEYVPGSPEYIPVSNVDKGISLENKDDEITNTNIDKHIREAKEKGTFDFFSTVDKFLRT